MGFKRKEDNEFNFFKKKKIKSNLCPIDYYPEDVVRIVNPRQYGLYIKNHVYPIDTYSSIDDNGKDVLIMIFLKSSTNEVYKAWCNHTLK